MIKSCNQTDHSIASGLSTPFFFTPRRSGRGVPCAGWWLPWSHSQAQPRFIVPRSEEHTSELQSRFDLVCRLLLEKKKKKINKYIKDIYNNHNHLSYTICYV